MSVQAIAWVLEDCPDLPPHLVSTMIGLANHADHNGKGAYVATNTIAWYTRKGRDAARDDLDRLEDLGLIRRGDQRMVLHLPPDSRPVVYDLALERKRAARPDRKRPGRPRKAKPQVSAAPENGGVLTPPGLIQDQTDNRGGLQTESGGSVDGIGGVHRPPKPSIEPSLNQTSSVAGSPEEEEPATEDPRLAAGQVLQHVQRDGGLPQARWVRGKAAAQLRDLLAPAFAAGWTAADAFLALRGSLVDVDRSVAGVLRHRITQLLEDDAPAPRPPKRQRVRWTVPWCGSCWNSVRRLAVDPDTRLATDVPCPVCGTDEHRLVSVA